MAMSHPSDEQLVVVVRTKNKELYSEIIRRYQVKLTHYLRRFIHSHDELEDVLQEVFIKSYRNLNGFDISKKFSSWIYRIAHNEAINHIKKYSKELLRLDDEDWDRADKAIDMAGAIDTAMARQKIERELARMKSKYSEPFILCYFEQKSYDEISEILHLPPSTVGVRIMRAKNILKKVITQ
ncbi:MAG: RNA polymerase sigma factor [Candidatus Magasanikbacteria bacterium]